jgi:hypothetical protein
MQFFAYVNGGATSLGAYAATEAFARSWGPDNSARAKGVAARRMMKPRNEEGHSRGR